MKRPANIKQVASEAGVSIATVSRALQSPDVVAPDTLERVMKAIRALGYYPNGHARGLRTDQSKMIIALVPDLGNSFFSEVIQGIEQVARTNGYAVLLGNTEYDQSREQAYTPLLSMRRVDGFTP